MADKISLVTITNGQNVSAINNNFTLLEEALNDAVLYRDNPSGTSNQMVNDLDMNSNDVLNGGDASFATLTVGGIDMSANVAAAAASATASAASATESAAYANAAQVSANASAASATDAANSAADASDVLASALKSGNNLSDVANAATSLSNLGGASSTDLSSAVATINTALATKAALSGATFTGPVSATTITSTDTTNSTSSTTGAVKTAGGLGVVGDIYCGGSYHGSAFIGAGTITSTPISGASGSFTTVAASGLISPTSTVGIKGTVAADNPSAGSVGEFMSASGSAIALTTSTAVNICSITLTPGDWDVAGNCQFTSSGNNLSTIQLWTSSTSATLPGSPNLGGMQVLSSAASLWGGGTTINCGTERFNVSVDTTVYLSAQATFASGTSAGNGFIHARRVR